MILARVQRDCICDPWMQRHGEHTELCSQRFKAKLLGRKDDVRALHAEGYQLAPECPVCAGNAVVTVPVGPRDEFGNQHTEEAPCPACSAGDDEAVARIGLPEFDALSRAALAPAPVTAADFLPNPPSPCSEPVRNRASLLHDDPETDAEGRPVSGDDLSAGQAHGPASRRSERDASPVAAVAAAPGPATVPSPSLVPARSPRAGINDERSMPASAVAPGRRSNLQARDAA